MDDEKMAGFDTYFIMIYVLTIDYY